jgi:hypothetical protein
MDVRRESESMGANSGVPVTPGMTGDLDMRHPAILQQHAAVRVAPDVGWLRETGPCQNDYSGPIGTYGGGV